LGIGGGFGLRKAPMAVIEKNRYRLAKPGGDENQINGMITVDVACFDQQAAVGTHQPDELASGGRELELDPVFRAAVGVRARLNAGHIRTKVAIEISDGKGQAPAERSGRRSLNAGIRCRGAAENAQAQK